MCSCKNKAQVATYCNYKLSRDSKKNPGPPTHIDPHKTIVAPCSQGNELVLGQNAGQQCAVMSSWSLIYYNTQGISSANDLIQIMNIGNQPYSSLSLLARQAYLMQSELPTAPNVFDTDYQLVLFTKKLLQRDISTVRLSKEPLSLSYLKATLIS